MSQSITLQTSDSNVQESDVLGRISFAASNESDALDARLVGGSIFAIAEGDFTSTANPTSLIFATAVDGVAADRIKISSGGNILPIDDNTYDIGSSGVKFKDLYANQAIINALKIQDLTVNEFIYIGESDGSVSSSDKITINNSSLSINVNNLTVNSTYTFPTSDGTNGQVLTTNGNGNVSWNTVSGGGGGSIDGNGSANHIAIWSDSDTLTYDDAQLYWDNANNRLGIGTSSPSYKLDIDGTFSANSININDAYTLPTSDGTNGQVLSTNGSGSVSWAESSSGGTATISKFTALDSMPPSTNNAGFSTRNNIPVITFDDGADYTDEATTFCDIIPEGADTSSGLVVEITWMSQSQTTGDVKWVAQFEKMTTDLDSDSFDTSSSGITTTSATPGTPVKTTITCTSIDSLVAGDLYRLKIYRNTSDTTNDTMINDAQVISIEVRVA